MNTPKRGSAALALGALLAAPAAGAVTSVEGIPVGQGATLHYVTLWESRAGGGVISAVGEELVGVGKVTEVRSTEGEVLWTDGTGGRELTVHIHSYRAESFEHLGEGVEQVRFAGGQIEIYVDQAGDFAVGGTLEQDIARATDGVLFLRLAGSAIGVAPGGNPITLQSLKTRLGAVSVVVTGAGLLDVVDGSAAAYFDTDRYLCEACPEPDAADQVFNSEGTLTPEGPWSFAGSATVSDVARSP